MDSPMVPSPKGWGAFRDSGASVAAASRASSTSSSLQPSAAAASRAVGRRPRCDCQSSSTRRRACTRSCTERGTCHAHRVSRQWRRSSPRIVGTAKLVNAIPRPGSNRFAALTRPR
jgi:hypothetical protein